MENFDQSTGKMKLHSSSLVKNFKLGPVRIAWVNSKGRVGSQNVLCWSVYCGVFKSSAQYRYSPASAGGTRVVRSDVSM